MLNVTHPRPATTAIALLLAGALASCGGRGDPVTTGTVQVAHDVAAVPALLSAQAHYSTFTGVNAVGAVVYGPVRKAYAADHALTDVPSNVVTLQVSHNHAAGHQVGSSTIKLGSSRGSTPVSAVVAPLPNRIKVELVNDTDNAGGDAAMYVMFDTPKTLVPNAASGIPLVGNSGASTATFSSFPLSTLTTSTSTVSPYTGKTRPVYAFTVDNVDSGRLSFSYGSPLQVVKGAAPTATTNVRYDKMELTFKPDPNTGIGGGGGNLTAIDFHAIPLQVEVTHAGQTQPDPLQTKGFYASMPTILKALMDMGKARNVDMKPAMRSISGGTFTFTDGMTDFSQFARVLSPNTIAAANGSNGSPAPYPSFAKYLTSLVGKSFKVNGTQHAGYKYTATVGKDGTGGFVITAVGSVNMEQTRTLPAPQVPGPAAAATVTVNLPANQMDFFIYATVANRSSYRVAGYAFQDGPVDPVTKTNTYTIQDTVNAANSSAYGALVGDIQAVLNFGYLGGRFDSSTQPGSVMQDISTYYASVMLPYAYPFGGARTTNDGFYNPYAGLFYYLSDAYGHPYSDRLASASPLYTLAPGDTVRITILNDNRLDTPLASVASASNTGLTVTWPAISGATGYTVKTQPASTGAACAPGAAAAGTTRTCAITGLKAGTSYLISVTAKGVSNLGAPVVSGTLPIQGMTTGTAPPTTSGTLAMQVAVNLPNTPVIPGMTAYVDGQTTAGGAQASLMGVLGENTFGLQVRDASNNIVYASTYVMTLSRPAGVASTLFDIGPLSIDYGLTPLTVAGPPSTPPYANAGGLVVGTPFAPKPYYKPFPTSFPQN